MSDQETTAPVTPEAEAPVADEAAAPETAEPKDWRAAKEAFIKGQTGDESEPEAKAEPAKPEPEKDPKEERYAKAFSMLTKERSKLRQAQEVFQREQAEWKAERETLHTFRETVGKDPVSALRALADRAGVPFAKLYSSLTQAILQDGQPPDPVEAAREATKAELAEWKAAQEKQQREAEEARQRQYLQGEYESTLTDLASLVTDEAYPFCATPLEGQSAEERAAQVAKAAMVQMAEHYGRTKQILEYDEALAQVEAELERAATLHARQAELAAKRKATRAPAPALETADDEPPPRARTITSRLTSDTGPARELDWKARRDRFLRGGT